MRSFLFLLLGLSATLTGFAQVKTPADFSYQHLQMRYQADTVHILVLSEKGEEKQRKPIFFFAQGSTPSPVVLYDEQGPYPLIPIRMDSLLTHYHLVVVGKPGLPLVGNIKQLGPGGSVADPKTGLLPVKYCQHNYLEYYVRRNQAVIRYLTRQPWVQANDITAMGHSEGSTVVARMARQSTQLCRVIYLAGSPLGRMLTQLSAARIARDSVGATNLFQRWQQVVAAPDEIACQGDSNYLIASLSSAQTPLDDLLHSKIPVFVGYGTRDRSTLLNDYLRLETIRHHKPNFSFHAYPEVEHNFFGFTDGQIDYEKGQWNKVAGDFLSWMKSH
jgi:dienelactone hydrolase